MSNILEQIVEKTKDDLRKQKRNITLSDLETLSGFELDRRSFAEALDQPDTVSIIAEVKKGSPSKGIIRTDFNPADIAKDYSEHGAAAISVLTNKPFFHGSLKHLETVRSSSPVPVLRKDFIIDPYQVKEAAAYGADAVLLIATICSKNQLSELLAATKEFGLQALVECYHEEEVDSLNWDEVEILGVNNRDLKKFEVNLHRGVELLKKAPDGVVRVSESGISSAEDLKFLYENGIHSALIGEHFMRQPKPGKAISDMKSELQSKIESV